LSLRTGHNEGLICVFDALHDMGDPTDAACLGAQAGAATLRSVLADAGFTTVRRATETPFNMILDVRP
jgi:NaMN:DMB phosphoribosyltransferase